MTKYSLTIPDKLDPDTLYWIGFLAGDGCIKARNKKNHARVCLELQRSDKEHLEKYKGWLKATHPIRDSAKNCAVIEIQSQAFADWLAQFNIIPRKKNTLQATPQLEQSRDYWRGLIDADGSITTNGKNRPAIELNGTKQICSQFIGYVQSQGIKTKALPRQKNANCWGIKFAARKAISIISHLYDEDCMALKRKKALAMSAKHNSLPNVTVDAVIFDMHDEDKIPRVLLIKRGKEPFKGMWSIPGGHLGYEEELEVGAARELYEETGLDIPSSDLQQVVAVGRMNRDPRDRIISVVYTAVVDRFEHVICAGDDAEDVRWFQVTELPELAADHLEIVRRAFGQVV